MLKLLKLKWSQRGGLRVHAHTRFYRPFKLQRHRDLLDVTRFNFIASELDWPEVGGECWLDEVRRALIDMEVTDGDDLTLYTKVGLAIALHGLVDGSLSLPKALAAIEKERALL